MPGKGTAYATALLNVIFNNESGTNWCTAAGNGNVFISLHTADPTTGNQNTSEANYSGYARVAIPRSTVGWTVSGNNAINAEAITFPACNGANSSNVTNVAIGAANTGTAGEIFYTGALTSSLNVSNGVTPSFNAGNLMVTEV